MAVRKIAICNFKGGVGKTVLSVNIAAGLAQRQKKTGENFRVLLVDADAQANSSVYMLGQDVWEQEIFPNPGFTLYGMFKEIVAGKRNSLKPEELVGGGPGVELFGAGRDWPSLRLLPAHYDLTFAEDLLKGERQIALPGRSKKVMQHQLLELLLAPIEAEFDFIIIDCPPNVYHVARNALYYADEVLVPVIPDWLSVSGLTWLILTLGEQFKNFGQEKRIRGIIPTLWNQIAVYENQMELIANKLLKEWKKNTTFKSQLKGCEFWEPGLMRAADIAKAVEEFRPLTDFSASVRVRIQIEMLVDRLLGKKIK